MIFACLDIGSTWTKGAAFAVEGDTATLLARATRPTTVGNLADGFFAVLHETLHGVVAGDPLAMIRSGVVGLRYSSSAKGGLAVAALGLVPDVTLEIGKIAAQSAGARLAHVFAYQLTRTDIATLEATPPDILLFAGGTDGGNMRYVLANAEAIAASSLDCDIVYAGNRAAAEEVAERLAGKRLRVVDNLLPSFDTPDPDPARDAIRSVFLETIVRGKGLDTIMDATGIEPVPTPFAVLEYTRAIRQHVPGWEQFMLFDMGGATTDVYSVHQEAPESGTVLRGLPEPEVKRTVEGDLGMRVSAPSASRAGDGKGAAAAQAALVRNDVTRDALTAYADVVVRQPDFLPRTSADAGLDTLLAGLCVGHAAARHVGRCTPIFTPEGEMQLQTGRDLRRVDKVVGSGGWLSRAGEFDPAEYFADHGVDARGRTVLLPRDFKYYRDADALFPLLANLARACPQAAAHAGIAVLTEG